MRVRDATPDERPAVLNVLDGAMLSTDSVGEHIAAGDVLVAVSADGERVLGALVLDGDHVEAVAVRRRRRGQGIGTALVEAATDRRQRLTAEFDTDVRPFYETLGFDIGPGDEPGRLCGTRRSADR
jgi:GNAT superfamily N-acetyltransferase